MPASIAYRPVRVRSVRPTKRQAGLALAVALLAVALLAMSAGRLFVAGVAFLAASLAIYAAESDAG